MFIAVFGHNNKIFIRFIMLTKLPMIPFSLGLAFLFILSIVAHVSECEGEGNIVCSRYGFYSACLCLWRCLCHARSINLLCIMLLDLSQIELCRESFLEKIGVQGYVHFLWCRVSM